MIILQAAVIVFLATTVFGVDEVTVDITSDCDYIGYPVLNFSWSTNSQGRLNFIYDVIYYM